MKRRTRLLAIWSTVGTLAVFSFLHLPILVGVEHLDYDGGTGADADGKRHVPMSVWTADADRIDWSETIGHLAVAVPSWFGGWALAGYGLARLPDAAWARIDRFLGPRRLVLALWAPGLLTLLGIAAHVHVGHAEHGLASLGEGQQAAYSASEALALAFLPWAWLSRSLLAPFGVGVHRWAYRPGSGFHMPGHSATGRQTYYPEDWTWSEFAWAAVAVAVGHYLVAALLALGARAWRRRRRLRTEALPAAPPRRSGSG